MRIIFDSKDFTRCLLNLGFVFYSQSSSHEKYNAPTGYPKDKGLRPFMIIQSAKSDYCKHSCSRYISELKAMGFTQDQITKAFGKK